MKKSFVITLLAVIVSAYSCKKENNSAEKSSDNVSASIAQDCTLPLADAENIKIFPATNYWNKDISDSPLNINSKKIIANFSSSPVHADFGSGLYDGAPIGIPYVVICGSQTKYDVVFRKNNYDGNYGDESDPGPYAIPLSANIEGDGNGDSHVIAVDKDNGILYELYNASKTSDHWEASSGAIFNLNSNKLRPRGWTSADAAGLPIFAGLVRYEEIVKGNIDHAIRFTLQSSNVKPAYIYPARHKVNSSGGQYGFPFGARIRLKAGFNTSGYSQTNQVILRAMKKYGLMLADIGSNMFISGAPDEQWDNDDLHELGNITGNNFEVVMVRH